MGTQPTSTSNRRPGRNDLCRCGSGLKFKKCHGDHVKVELSKLAYMSKFDELIEIEKLKGKKDGSN